MECKNNDGDVKKNSCCGIVRHIKIRGVLLCNILPLNCDKGTKVRQNQSHVSLLRLVFTIILGYIQYLFRMCFKILNTKSYHEKFCMF